MNTLRIGTHHELTGKQQTGPLLLIGQSGQGKSVTLTDIVLQQIAAGEPGVVYDPYGDIADTIMEHVTSEEHKSRLRVVSQTEYEPTESDDVVVITGNKKTDGAAATQEQAQTALEKVYDAGRAQWLAIDAAFDVMNDELFASYVASNSPQTVVSVETLTTLSAKQRTQLFDAASHYIVFKPEKMDAQFFDEAFDAVLADDLLAVEKYHFTFLSSGTISKGKGTFPLGKV